VKGTVRTVGPKPALSNSFGFGGHNATLIFGAA
jgi:3-oxoacyl-(acyl-carrier-protein) synthase